MNQAFAYKAYEEDSVGLTDASPFFLDHVTRYWWASEQAAGLDVLDCACGTGYGTFILSQKARSVVGIDLNTRSLAMARETFARPNISFTEQDILALPMGPKRFDLITAFEVIEHIPPSTTALFLQGLAHSLKPGGKILLSTPNHDVVLKSGVFVPEFHINNFKPSELKDALRNSFGKVQMLGQFRQRQGLNQLVFSLDFFNLRHSVARWLAKGRAAPADVVDLRGERATAEQRRALYTNPPPEYSLYRFSAGHWRQAGLTVAVCSEPRGSGWVG